MSNFKNSFHWLSWLNSCKVLICIRFPFFCIKMINRIIIFVLKMKLTFIFKFGWLWLNRHFIIKLWVNLLILLLFYIKINIETFLQTNSFIVLFSTTILVFQYHFLVFHKNIVCQVRCFLIYFILAAIHILITLNCQNWVFYLLIYFQLFQSLYWLFSKMF